MALKAFVEGIRLSVLTQNALQHLQPEILGLRQALPRYFACQCSFSSLKVFGQGCSGCHCQEEGGHESIHIAVNFSV